MPADKSRPQDRPWESGWAPDTTRAPGTRRLWLAGALALATITACVTALTVMENDSAVSAPRVAEPTALAASAPGGLISFATPSRSAGTDRGEQDGRPSSTPTTGAPSGSASPGPDPAEKAPKPSASRPPAKSPAPPAATGTSLRSVNYPDRYWRVRDGYVRLDRIGSSGQQRADATFRRVPGLADSSCLSFTTADGRYLRHRDFVLAANPDDGSALFRQDATFCPRPSSVAGATMLESVNYPGRFLRHRSFQLRLEPYEHSDLYRADSAFHLGAGLG
ncbi:AbfB domain-containing protein [Streptomyces sp. bgisy032]|uniref:AbfB domain-containing protein n=1 Tax=Streptomyces sp. bgisy032 TaxID=3413773 RepID=UPI003D708629